jgi:Dolichyl-phosphate-mannose-protein mannosyltransferase
MAVMDATLAVRAETPATVPIVKNRFVWLVAAAAFGVEMAVSARYGYVRDELYFLAAGAHPAAGYVDQPALTPLLARLDALLTGNTLVGLRALPALVFGLMVLFTAAMARTLGAGRRGQLVAALATACCSVYVAAMHELTTATPDFLAWTVTLLLVCKLLTSGDQRWWVAIGAAAGVGAFAKWNIGFLVAGLALGFAVTPGARPLLRSRYLLLGAAVFAACAAPDVVWQAAHGWPNFAVFRALNTAAWSNRIQYWPDQVLYTTIVLVPLWVGGIVWALRDATLRAIGIAAVFVIGVQFILGGKAYYPDGIYTFCFAAGATALGAVLASGSRWRRRAAGYCAGGVICSVISLPVLPAAALASFPVQKINYDLGEEIGWPSEVGQLASVWRGLPLSERAVATVLTGNYGEAGAVARYGAGFGLPRAYSGANSFWFWGPPPAADTVAVAINVDPALLHRWFTSVRAVAVYRNGLGVADDEEGATIYVATGLRSSWATAWPSFRDFS